MCADSLGRNKLRCRVRRVEKCTEVRSMKHIQEKAREIPIAAETDVLVVGSGPGGLAAALAAARTGVDTMLVERYGCFGGNITQAMVESIA